MPCLVILTLIACFAAGCSREAAHRFPCELRRLAVLPLEPGAEVVCAVGPSRLACVSSTSGVIQLLDIADPSRPAMLGTHRIGAGEPTSVAARADGSEIYVSVKLADSDHGILVALTVDPKGSLEPARSYRIGIGPDSVALTQDQKTVVVAIEDESTPRRPGRIDLVDVTTPAGPASVRSVPIPQFQDPEPEVIALAPDGVRAFVTLQEQAAVIEVDIVRATVTATTQLSSGIEPDGITFLPDGVHLVTANEEGQSISIFRSTAPATPLTHVATIPIGTSDGLRIRHPLLSKRTDPEGVTAHVVAGIPIVYVGLERTGALVAYDVSQPERPRIVAVTPSGLTSGSHPEILCTLNDGTVVVANERENTIGFFRLASHVN